MHTDQGNAPEIPCLPRLNGLTYTLPQQQQTSDTLRSLFSPAPHTYSAT
ncbi:hypothetical protein Q0590_29365 [Rhodocytophaga aerolata]|uniref:Uncharacterized protein n=1 Tax=Rhodocytophaga aerolata TaxID=455078 RepID=A0ABT8REE3_9BACT|nr:hypothetical protein [Rhodocytophaga aerolata]MDO1450420.1 hypothetical protein [Rhodocytophaga aerolata]